MATETEKVIMTDVTKTLELCNAELWAFRDEMGEDWPTPDTELSLQFAFCESGEALDAWIRYTYPTMARNNDCVVTEDDILDELADTAMMLLTAAGTKLDLRCVPNSVASGLYAKTTTSIAIMLGRLLVACLDDRIGWKTDIGFALYIISLYPGMDLQARLQARYARIRAKQRPVKLVETDGVIGGVASGRDLFSKASEVEARWHPTQAGYQRNALNYGRQVADAKGQPYAPNAVRPEDGWGTDTL